MGEWRLNRNFDQKRLDNRPEGRCEVYRSHSPPENPRGFCLSEKGKVAREFLEPCTKDPGLISFGTPD